jgi:hypothetical protein
MEVRTPAHYFSQWQNDFWIFPLIVAQFPMTLPAKRWSCLLMTIINIAGRNRGLFDIFDMVGHRLSLGDKSGPVGLASFQPITFLWTKYIYVVGLCRLRVCDKWGVVPKRGYAVASIMVCCIFLCFYHLSDFGCRMLILIDMTVVSVPGSCLLGFSDVSWRVMTVQCRFSVVAVVDFCCFLVVECRLLALAKFFPYSVPSSDCQPGSQASGTDKYISSLANLLSSLLFPS